MSIITSCTFLTNSATQFCDSSAPGVGDEQRLAIMATTLMNGTPSTEGNASNAVMSNPGRQQSKGTFNSKNIDGNRKQVGNPSDATK